MVDLDARGQQQMKRPEPNGELEVVQIGPKLNQTIWINKNLPTSLKEGRAFGYFEEKCGLVLLRPILTCSRFTKVHELSLGYFS